MSNFNKVITNIPVPLTETEVSNLSQTLSGIVQGGGGGGEGKTYNGDGVYVTVNNDTNPGVINLTQTAKDKLNRPIPSAVADLTDADEYATKSFVAGTYQTIAGMNGYQTKDDMSAYLTKASASQNLAPISVTADIEVLKANSGDFTQYYKKTETSSKEELSAEFAKYQLSGNYVNQSDYNTEKNAIWLELQTLEGTKQNNLDFDTDEHGNISAINDIPLAGQGGKTYSAGVGIAIVDEYISLSADYIQAITQVSGKQDVLAFTYDSSGSIIKINNSAIAGGAGGGSVSYTGRNGVEINGNYIELETTAKNAVDSVGGIATDVGTLKTASAGWDKVSDKLDTTAFSTVSGTFLTTIPDTYATKEYANNASANALSEAKTWVGQQGFYTKASGDNDYAPISITATVNTLTGASASWNEVSAKLGTAQYANDSATFVTSSNSTISGTKQYALTTAGWSEITGGGSTFTGVTTASPITGDGLNNTLGLDSNYKTAIEQVSGKVDKPADMTSNTPYCFSGGQWADITQTYYSKTEATGTFLQKNLTNTLSGDGTSNNTLGVNWSNLSSNTINSANSAGEAQGFRWGDNTYQDTSAALTNLWNSKNHVTLQTANNFLTVDNNDNTSATLSAMSYVANPNRAGFVPQKACVCNSDQILSMSQLANGQGMLFFIVSAASV